MPHMLGHKPAALATLAFAVLGCFPLCAQSAPLAAQQGRSFPKFPTLPISGWVCAQPKGKLKLDLNATGFSKTNAYWLSWAALQAYGHNLYRTGNLAAVGLTQTYFFANKSTSLLGFVAANEDSVVVSYAGTDDFQDLRHDFGFNLRQDTQYNVPGKLHRGFLSALDLSWPEIYKTILDFSENGRKKVFISGHSLGAAMSTLTAARLVAAGFDVGGAYLFSSPRVGDRIFADALNAKLPNRLFRFVNNEDIVPRLPPPAEAATEFSEVFTGPARDFIRETFLQNNYTHVGQKVTFDASGKMSAPSSFEEAEDARYWSNLTERSKTLRPLSWLVTNWRLLGDHIPATNFCYIKLDH